MNISQVGITAATTLIAVALGGWLTTRAQDRLWRRDDQRQWRDIRLVSGRSGVVQASNMMVLHARLLAAERATHDVETIPAERFEDLWAAERNFVLAARDELGLPEAFEISGRPHRNDGGGDPNSSVSPSTTGLTSASSRRRGA